jgi:hypothetical protein
MKADREEMMTRLGAKMDANLREIIEEMKDSQKR